MKTLLEGIGRALRLDGPYVADAFTEVHGGAVRDDGRVAWVEERRVGEDNGGFVDASLTIKVAWGGALHVEAELPSYNPYFGCTVYGLAWSEGDRVVLAYHEKHASLVSVWTMTGEVELVRCNLREPIAMTPEFVVYQSDDPGLFHLIAVPELFAVGPIPVPDETAFERVALPTRAQTGMTENVETFQRAVVERLLREVKVSRELLEVLVGSSCEAWWEPGLRRATTYEGVSGARRGPSLRWFPVYWFEWLQSKGRHEEAQAILVAFDALGGRRAALGWEAAWSREEGLVELAAQHVAMHAERLSEVCATGKLPEHVFDALWWRERVDVSHYPPALQHAFLEVSASPPKSFADRK
ncbi:MAG: hypothetical protein JNM69_04165 [Archangium sp.]|nr:hypothetical protein [Archangium sp.]